MSDHDERGRFVPQNRAALVHGGRSRQVAEGKLEIQAELLARLAEDRAEIERDLRRGT